MPYHHLAAGTSLAGKDQHVSMMHKDSGKEIKISLGISSKIARKVIQGYEKRGFRLSDPKAAMMSIKKLDKLKIGEEIITQQNFKVQSMRDALGEMWKNAKKKPKDGKVLKAGTVFQANPPDPTSRNNF